MIRRLDDWTGSKYGPKTGPRGRMWVAGESVSSWIVGYEVDR